jgi:hypothetical protein
MKDGLLLCIYIKWEITLLFAREKEKKRKLFDAYGNAFFL